TCLHTLLSSSLSYLSADARLQHSFPTRRSSDLCSRRFGGATCDDKSAQIYARFDKNDWRIQPAEFYRFHDAEVNTLQVGYANHFRSEERFSRNAETDLVCHLLLVKKKQLLVIL